VTVPPSAAFTLFCGSLAGSRIVTVTAFGSVATTTFDALGGGADGAALAEATGAEADAVGAAGALADADADTGEGAGAGEGFSSHATRENAMQTRKAAFLVLMQRASSPREHENDKGLEMAFQLCSLRSRNIHISDESFVCN